MLEINKNMVLLTNASEAFFKDFKRRKYFTI